MVSLKAWCCVITFVFFSAWILQRIVRSKSTKIPNSRLPSIVVLMQIVPTTNFRAMQQTIRSIKRQEGNYKFYFVVIDLHCSNGVRGMLKILLHGASTKVVQICDAGSEIRTSYEFIATYQSKIESDWVLFLKAGLIFEPHFIQNMLDLTQTKPDVEAVGCKVVTADKSELVSAGSILWNDGTIQPYGVNNNASPSADEFSYARRVDFVSDSCLLINSDVLNSKYEGPVSHFASNFQLEITLNRDKFIWYSPISVASDLLSATVKPVTDLLDKKWMTKLSEFPDFPRTNASNDHDYLRARDTRRRNEGSINILYIDDRFPNRNSGSGYGRAVDNLLMMSDLGHCITVTAAYDEGCDVKCKQGLQMHGLEVVHQSTLKSLLEIRNGFYEIIIVSRPSTYGHIHSTLHRAVSKMDASVMYDAEALWYRRDEKLLDLIDFGYDAPGAMKYMQTFDKKVHDETREMEIALLQDPDVITTVTNLERSIIQNFTYGKNAPQVNVIGHIMESNNPTQATFDNRIGVMFLAAYSNLMYYNGDAIWGFLKSIYPEVLRVSPISIPVTIAGRGVPKELHDFVYKRCRYCQNVTILESPKNIRKLYNKARVFIAPHLYGAGVQYKVNNSVFVNLVELNFS